MNTNPATIRVLYFAWLREQIGLEQETINVEIGWDAMELITHLKGISAKHADALSNIEALKIAINHQISSKDSQIKPGDEIALFPPVTGG